MRAFLIGFALLATPIAFFFAACGQDPASAATGTSGTGGAPNCEGVYLASDDLDGSNPCDICLHDNCCAELANCRDKACLDCVSNLPPGCGWKPKAVSDCLDIHCPKTCGPSHPTVGSSGAGGTSSG